MNKLDRLNIVRRLTNQISHSKRQKQMRQRKLSSLKKLRCRVEFIYNPKFEEDNYYIFGGLYFSMNMMRENENPLRDNGQDILSINYCLKKGVILIFPQEVQHLRVETQEVIDKAYSNNCQDYKLIADYLVQYQSWINHEIFVRSQYFQYLKNKKQIDNYQNLFIQFQEWALSKIDELDGNQVFFSFQIHLLSPDTFDYNSTITGYSTALLALRGLDIINPGFALHRRLTAIFSKKCSFTFLMNQLKKAQNEPQAPCPLEILTFDDHIIQCETNDIRCNNRDEMYPYLNAQIRQPPYMKMAEFKFNIRIYQIDQQQIIKVVSQRQADHCWESRNYYQSLDNYTQACKFLHKFYPNEYEKMNEIEDQAI